MVNTGILLDEARELGYSVARVAMEIRREKERCPELWARYHARMAVTVPRWRILARWHHLRLARRFQALEYAKSGSRP